MGPFTHLSDYPTVHAAVEAAIEQLDAARESDAQRGLRDGIDGIEYLRMSPAPVLRRWLAENPEAAR